MNTFTDTYFFFSLQFIFNKFYFYEFHISDRKHLGNCSNTFPIGLSNLKHLFGLDATKISLNDLGSRSLKYLYIKIEPFN